MGDDGIFRRPAVPQPVRIRRDINHLAPDDPIVVWYARAIRAMQTRAFNDPLSWRYQAAIHDYPAAGLTTAARRRSDPNAVDTDVFPADHLKYWRKCEHGVWFFVAWHRMYLHFFEKIVANHVVALGGPTGWALPYWNYSASPTAALLPIAFRGKPGDERTNALYIPQRSLNANNGLTFLDPDSINLDCLSTRPFGQDAGTFGFGGFRSESHARGTAGTIENVPHNTVHGTLGSGGFMSNFVTAPLDPMFWLHHANIDRLWEVWVQRQKAIGNLDRNPKVRSSNPQADNDIAQLWLSQNFDFHDAAGNPATMKTKDVQDTRTAPLSYEYEDTSDPRGGTP